MRLLCRSGRLGQRRWGWRCRWRRRMGRGRHLWLGHWLALPHQHLEQGWDGGPRLRRTAARVRASLLSSSTIYSQPPAPPQSPHSGWTAPADPAAPPAAGAPPRLPPPRPPPAPAPSPSRCLLPPRHRPAAEAPAAPLHTPPAWPAARAGRRARASRAAEGSEGGRAPQRRSPGRWCCRPAAPRPTRCVRAGGPGKAA